MKMKKLKKKEGTSRSVVTKFTHHLAKSLSPALQHLQTVQTTVDMLSNSFACVGNNPLSPRNASPFQSFFHILEGTPNHPIERFNEVIEHVILRMLSI